MPKNSPHQPAGKHSTSVRPTTVKHGITQPTPRTSTTQKTTPFELTQDKVERFLADAERSLHDDLARAKGSAHSKTMHTKSAQDNATLAQRFLQRFPEVGRHGFKSPHDLFNFLKTPSGGSLKKLIGTYYATEKSHAHKTASAQQKALKKRRLAAYAFLAQVMRKKKKKKQLLEAYAKAAEEAIERAKESASLVYIGGGASELPATDLALQRLEEAIALEIQEKSAELKSLDEEIARLKQQRQEIIERHTASNARLENVFSQIETVLTKPLTGKPLMDLLSKETQYLKQKMEKTTEQDVLAQLVARSQLLEQVAQQYSLDADSAHDLLPKEAIEVMQLEQFAREIDEEILTKLSEAPDLIAQGRKSSEEIFTELFDLSLARDVYQEQIDVLNKEMRFLNEHGDEVFLAKDAHYTIPSSMQLKMENGKTYLLKPGQDFNLMTEQEKEKAHQSFLKKDYHSENQQAKQRQAAELEANAQVTQAKLEKRKVLEVEIKTAHNQKNDFNALRANLLENPEATNPLGKKNPSMQLQMNPASKQQPKEKQLPEKQDAYQEMLQILAKKPTPQDINLLRQIMPQTTKVQATINQIVPGIPIPPQIAQFMIRNYSMNPVFNTTADTRKQQPKETWAQQAEEMRKTVNLSPLSNKSEESTSNQPTPLSTTPRPTK